MKKIFTLWAAVFIAVIIVIPFLVQSQETFTYSLGQNLQGLPSPAPDLIQIPNNSGDTGDFVARTVPASTCGQQGTAHGYFFEDDAGLQFNNPSGFIDQSYSIAFNFQVDEFISPPPWVRILSFTHTDDVGIYINLTDPPDHGTLEFWPYGTVGTTNFFTTVDFYQLILVRNDSALIRIYVNGSEFATYDDSQSQKYVPQQPNNYIIWFRDHPSVLAGEASPGFVNDIRIANYAWTPQKVQEVWQNFCSSLLRVGEPVAHPFRFYPNPVKDNLYMDIPAGSGTVSVTLFSLTGQVLLQKETGEGNHQMDVSALVPGMYLLRVKDRKGVHVYRFSKE